MNSANTGSLRLTQGTGWALKALSALALDGGQVSVASLAAREGIPREFLGGIISRLTRARVVEARGGRGGGVRLAVPADRLPLIRIVEACEGPYARMKCLYYPLRTCDGADCVVFCPVRKTEESARTELEKTMLSELASSLAAHPDRPLNAMKAAPA